MRTVSIDLGKRSYDIRIGEGLMSDAKEYLPWFRSDQVLLVSNEVVGPEYADRVRNALGDTNLQEVTLPDGEHTKTLDTAKLIFDALLQAKFDRTSTIIALGGGVIGDMAGFCAACYQRGIQFVQVPTTLLSQVDSSVGGKTAVNHPLGKNMIGAFHQPVRVLADTSTLSTLPEREFSAGLAEVIKYGVINDPELFEWLESNVEQVMALEQEKLEYVIERSCQNKSRIVEQDETEAGMRALLNLGHTFGHAIENSLGYGEWLHGEAISLGMVMAAHLSLLDKRIESSSYDRLIALLKRAALPTEPFSGLSAESMFESMKVDKKVHAGQMRFVLMDGIGRSVVTSEYSPTHLDLTLQHFCQSS
ncbi:MAG: 3-dehydroquinate synthase [Pseudomonadota bacterium]